MKIKLVRSRDTFCLMGANGAKLTVMHASMFVRKIRLSPSVFVAYSIALENSTAKYSIKSMTCKLFAILQNRYITYEKLMSGQLLTCLVMRLVDNDAFSRSSNCNQLNFQYYN